MPLENSPPNRPRWTRWNTLSGAVAIVPYGTDTSEWIEVSGVSDFYARFLKPNGDMVDCAKYAKLARPEGGAA